MISHPVNVATPLEALSGFVVHPPSVPAPDAMAKVIGALEVVTTLPLASSTWTTGWALNGTPLSVVPGVVVNTNCVADPAASTRVWDAVTELVP